MDWQLISLFLAILAGILSLMGGLFAKDIRPDSSANIQHLVETLEPFLRTQRDLLKLLATQTSEPIAAPAEIYNAYAVAAERACQATKRIEGALDTNRASARAGTARAWMCSGALAAFLSATIQIWLQI